MLALSIAMGQSVIVVDLAGRDIANCLNLPFIDEVTDLGVCKVSAAAVGARHAKSCLWYCCGCGGADDGEHSEDVELLFLYYRIVNLRFIIGSERVLTLLN